MIVGVTIVRNAIEMGYPFVEAILTAMEICDVYHISDGYSTDGTWETLNKLKVKHHNISLSRYKWPKMETGFAIGAATNFALDQVREYGGYILYVQADELWHSDSLKEMRRLAGEGEYDAFIVPFLHLEHNCQQVQEGAGYQLAVRMVQNSPTITSHRDAWTFEGYEKPLAVFSLPHRLVHCNYCFWDNIPVKRRVQAEELYPDLGHYKYAAEQWEYDPENIPEKFTRTTSPFMDDLPPIFHPMLGQRKYFVREELLL